ncbi:uncharacterized protein LOC110725593 [Chenopodium quinoa]|uniref:Telomere-associated protein Rif1 N-terminal domain-containing protein n=1 Tax=Chenopodium quinoa TaxID=63459 RepID=A0A803LH61_CHEQI|nr:uncharacterized protein LOC110725593 [Chenopodium quinoa]
MSNFPEQLEQIKTLICSSSKLEKSFAYSTLQHLQEQASTDDSLIQLLVDFNKIIISSIIDDIQIIDADEEISTLALKCLGFIIYHPSFVVAISKEYVDQVLESLAKLILTTKIKVVCNLGVWCISIQQLDASHLASHFESLLRAVVHSLDNPTGSLSTTFEAIQAVMKLANQISEKMRESSSIWAPSIYRRLLSGEKKERDMCIRCLLMIKFLIVPPQLALSKAIAQDMKLSLLSGMDDMLKHGKKVQALQAWGWYIRILGQYSMKNRHLVNALLKVPEQTFSDPDPQIQIATQVAWEGLIDAFIFLPSKECGGTSQVNGGTGQNKAFSKSLKLIMTPLVGIMTSKAGLSVQSSCLNTWCYLLHKLDTLVNDPHIQGIVVEPLFKVVFNIGLEDDNVWRWRLCMDLLHDIIQSKTVSYGSHTQVDGTISPVTTDKLNLVSLSEESTLKNYSIRWLPWDCSQVDFLLRTIQMIFCQVAKATLCPKIKRLVCDAATRMFCFFLKGVQIDFMKSSTNYDTVMQSMNAILVFVKTVCDTASSVDDATNDFQLACLRTLEAVTQELDPSILGSSLYKVALVMKCRSTDEVACNMLTGIGPTKLMEMVPPIIYLTVYYFCLMVQLSNKEASIGSSDSSLQEGYKYFTRVLSSYDSLQVIHAITVILYDHFDHNSLRVWITIAQCLKEYLDGAKDMMPMRTQPASTGCITLCHFFVYPLIVCTSRKTVSTQKQCNSRIVSSCLSENLSQVKEVWMSLYCLVNSTNLQENQNKNSFAEDLCSSLNDFLQRSNTGEVDPPDNSQEHHFLSFCGNIAECILKNLHIKKVTPEAIKGDYTESSGINNCLEFIARLINLMSTINEAPEHVISRILPPFTYLVSCLQWKEDIISLFKVLCDPLLPWLSESVINCESIKCQLQILWEEIIRSLLRSWPTIVFDSSFLELQAPLLEKTLDHPNPSISNPTITFWNSAYGDLVHLDIPPCLLNVLDKLLRVGRLKIRNRKAPAVEKNSSSLEVVTSLPKHNVTATLNMCSKRVKLMENVVDGSPCKSKLPPPSTKRKRSELTEHQKEVRRAQQGRLRDCSGHGPGVRTYTGADFSQGNHEDSQDSQDFENVRDSELILNLLRKSG